MAALRHEELSYRLRGLIFHVRNELQEGWSEEIYHQALVELLQSNGIPYLSKPRKALVYRQEEIHVFEPDLIVWDTIILELKALPYQTQFLGEQYAQIIHYLKFFRKDLELLVNFSPQNIQIKRVLWDESELDTLEDYTHIRSHLFQEDRKNLGQLRQHILAIARQYGLGYPETVYRQLVAVEVAQNQLSCETEVEIPATWNSSVLAYHKTQLLLAVGKYLIHIRSLLDYPTQYDFSRMNTYLNSLELQFGFVVNFGKRQMQIYGVKST